MIKDLNIDNVLYALNGMLQLDKVAMSELFNEHRVSCNKELFEHPTVQCNFSGADYSVGVLGVINGLLGVYEDGHLKGWGPIAMMVSDEGIITAFVESKEAKR